MGKNLATITTLLIIVIIGIIYLLPKKEAIAPVIFDTTPYTDLSEVENVEDYLRKNIETLSPVKAVLGGTWYIISMRVDPEKNSGTIVYEDGHIQEKRNFLYTVNDKREVLSLTIK